MISDLCWTNSRIFQSSCSPPLSPLPHLSRGYCFVPLFGQNYFFTTIIPSICLPSPPSYSISRLSFVCCLPSCPPCFLSSSCFCSFFTYSLVNPPHTRIILSSPLSHILFSPFISSSFFHIFPITFCYLLLCCLLISFHFLFHSFWFFFLISLLLPFAPSFCCPSPRLSSSPLLT